MNARRIALMLILALLLALPAGAAAETRVKGLNEKYEILIDDAANLLSDSEEQRLVDSMKPLSQYGTVVFWTTRSGFGGTESMARSYLSDHVSTDIRFSCAMFLIDMSHRQLWIECRGAMLDAFGIANSYTVTGDVASKATAKRYYECASEAFGKMDQVFRGNRLASPMRILCSVLIALAAALLIAYNRVRKGMQPVLKMEDVAAAVHADVALDIAESKLIRETQTRRSSDSSSSGCSSCGGGGSSCSSCGGGGGSGF